MILIGYNKQLQKATSMQDHDVADAFRQRLAALRFTPSPSQTEEMSQAFPHLAQMLSRLPSDLTFADEPVAAFTADAMPHGDLA